MALISDVAEAIVVALNGNTFSQSMTAVRSYQPVVNLDSLSDLTVTVVPKDVELTLSTRWGGQSDLGIDIGIQKKLTTGDNSEIDVLMGLVEEMTDFIRVTRSFGVAKWLRTGNDPIYVPEHLNELRVFTSILALTLRAVKA